MFRVRKTRNCLQIFYCNKAQHNNTCITYTKHIQINIPSSYCLYLVTELVTEGLARLANRSIAMTADYYH